MKNEGIVMQLTTIKKILVIGGVVTLSIILGIMTSQEKQSWITSDNLKAGIIEQRSENNRKIPYEVQTLYYKDEIVARVRNIESINKHFEDAYLKEYEKEFPDSRIGLDQDLYYLPEMTYSEYENVDEQVINFLEEKKLYNVETNKVTFSNGAIIYVKDEADFQHAREKFALNFLDESTMKTLQDNRKIEPLAIYGEQVIDFNVKETIKIEKDFTSPDNIYKDESEILKFLSYGYDPSIETYTTQKLDTIPGIAWQFGMTPNQIVSINTPKIKSPDQVLEDGTVLNVSKFNSPFTIETKQERYFEEIIEQPNTEYIEDDTLNEGVQVVETIGSNGIAEKRYHDTYINGNSVESELIKSKILLEPVQEVVRVGTHVEPSQGSGRFGWPLANAYVLCGFGCYAGHKGVDFSTYGSGFGPILASDNGVVSQKGFHSRGWGNFIKINHGNGYETLYAHMNAPGYFPVGAKVAKGTVIGYVGLTGTTNYPHVHFEVWDHGTRVDGCKFVGC